jgi:hypothetical protein
LQSDSHTLSFLMDRRNITAFMLRQLEQGKGGFSSARGCHLVGGEQYLGQLKQPAKLT